MAALLQGLLSSLQRTLPVALGGSRRAGDDACDELDGVSNFDLTRSARVLALRSRREAGGSFAGDYASAFRGGGMEFEESRPYSPGDDVRRLDWNATVRTGQPHVKRFREERDQVVLMALDTSESMRFGTRDASKAASASRVLALLTAAASHAGDRVGLLTFDSEVRVELEPRKGQLHAWKIVDLALKAAAAASGPTRIAAPCETILEQARNPVTAVLFSDFRDPNLFAPRSGSPRSAADPRFSALCARHDVVSIVLRDAAEESLPRVGRIRVRDPEAPDVKIVIDSNSARVRARYEAAWRVRSRDLERALRRAGSDVLWLDTHQDPLRTLIRFCRARATRPRLAR